MKGTEKQVAWAETIRANVIGSFVKFIEDVRSYDAPEEIKTANITGAQERIEALTRAEDARDIIDLFKDIRFTGDNKKDFPKVMAVYRTTVPNTKGQHNILMK